MIPKFIYIQQQASETQCDGMPTSLSSSPISSPILTTNSSIVYPQERLSSPYIDLSLTNSNNERLQLFQSLIHDRRRS